MSEMAEFIHSVIMPLKLLKYLRLNGRTKIEDLSKELGLEERTVRRYYESLKKVGYPLKSKPGRGGGCYLQEPTTHQSEWEMLRSALSNYPELYRKIETRLLEEFKPQE